MQMIPFETPCRYIHAWDLMIQWMETQGYHGCQCSIQEVARIHDDHIVHEFKSGPGLKIKIVASFLTNKNKYTGVFVFVC